MTNNLKRAFLGRRRGLSLSSCSRRKWSRRKETSLLSSSSPFRPVRTAEAGVKEERRSWPPPPFTHPLRRVKGLSCHGLRLVGGWRRKGSERRKPPLAGATKKSRTPEREANAIFLSEGIGRKKAIIHASLSPAPLFPCMVWSCASI